jgi:succinoglycan biosynthesis protein ExoM
MSRRGPLLDVAVCVITYRRPAPLARLLRSIQRLHVPPQCSVRVLVVDNDPEGSAHRVAAATEGPLPVDYDSEPRPGIAAARNRAVQRARPCDLIAFLDDDMTVEPDWLANMVDARCQHHADMVNGVVEPVLDAGHSPWVDPSLFSRRRHPTGAVLDHAATGGLLLDPGLADRLTPLFDESFGLCGGADTDMSQRAIRAGARAVFSEGAVAYEHTPAPRATARWVLRRAFRLGNTTALCAIRAAEGSSPRALARLRAATGGLARILAGVLGVLVALPVGDRVLLTARCRRILQGAGLAAGALGWTFEEYGRARRRPSFLLGSASGPWPPPPAPGDRRASRPGWARGRGKGRRVGRAPPAPRQRRRPGAGATPPPARTGTSTDPAAAAVPGRPPPP